MRIQQKIYLQNIGEEGSVTNIFVYVNRKGEIGDVLFNLHNAQERNGAQRRLYAKDPYKAILRRNDRQWAYNHIPSSIMWKVELHHDWKNGGIMFLLDPEEHKRITYKERGGERKIWQ